MKKVVHLIAGLGKGGAETMLLQTLKYGDRTNYQCHIISLCETHYYEKTIEELGIPIVEAPIKRRPLKSIVRIAREIRNADTLCCWMYHSNFIGYCIGCCVGVKRIIWFIRHGATRNGLDKRSTNIINILCARFSRKIDKIAYNGEESRRLHEAIGYSANKGVVLRNGVDCEKYTPNEAAGTKMRKELGISENKKIILSVTRNNPVKDIPTFIKSYALLHNNMQNTAAVMCGSGITGDNDTITELCQENKLQIGKDIYLLGVRDDVQDLQAGCDLYVLNSAVEAFPNTLIQAMACECICVTTNVGDVSKILDDSRWIVPAKDPIMLSIKMNEALTLSDEEKRQIGSSNRKLILDNFDITEIVNEYEALY